MGGKQVFAKTCDEVLPFFRKSRTKSKLSFHELIELWKFCLDCRKLFPPGQKNNKLKITIVYVTFGICELEMNTPFYFELDVQSQLYLQK